MAFPTLSILTILVMIYVAHTFRCENEKGMFKCTESVNMNTLYITDKFSDVVSPNSFTTTNQTLQCMRVYEYDRPLNKITYSRNSLNGQYTHQFKYEVQTTSNFLYFLTPIRVRQLPIVHDISLVTGIEDTKDIFPHNIRVLANDEDDNLRIRFDNETLFVLSKHTLLFLSEYPVRLSSNHDLFTVNKLQHNVSAEKGTYPIVFYAVMKRNLRQIQNFSIEANIRLSCYDSEIQLGILHQSDLYTSRVPTKNTKEFFLERSLGWVLNLKPIIESPTSMESVLPATEGVLPPSQASTTITGNQVSIPIMPPEQLMNAITTSTAPRQTTERVSNLEKEMTGVGLYFFNFASDTTYSLVHSYYLERCTGNMDVMRYGGSIKFSPNICSPLQSALITAAKYYVEPNGLRIIQQMLVDYILLKERKAIQDSMRTLIDNLNLTQIHLLQTYIRTAQSYDSQVERPNNRYRELCNTFKTKYQKTC